MFIQFIIFCSIFSNIALFVALYCLKLKLDENKKNFYKQISNKSDNFVNSHRRLQIECNTLKKTIEDLNAKIDTLTKENTGLKLRNNQLEDDSKVFDPEHKDLLKILHTFTNTFNDHVKKYNMHFTNEGECVYYKEAGDHNFYYYDDSAAIGALIDSLDQNKAADKKSKGLSDNNSSNGKLIIKKVIRDDEPEPDEVPEPLASIDDFSESEEIDPNS